MNPPTPQSPNPIVVTYKLYVVDPPIALKIRGVRAKLCAANSKMCAKGAAKVSSKGAAKEAGKTPQRLTKCLFCGAYKWKKMKEITKCALYVLGNIVCFHPRFSALNSSDVSVLRSTLRPTSQLQLPAFVGLDNSSVR